ncbi:MAG TPA: sugar phosphate isomerase/epimerase family protein [Thermomicrobiales bacterium]|nr:sugar phosphate isomerase/epimerase family protein [Thermomicrobiales bacterium]
MKLGVSSYSFATAFATGTMDILDAIDWIAGSSASHLEISLAGLGQDLIEQPDLVAAIKQRATEKNVPLVNYVVGANFRDSDLAGQIARLKKHIDIAHDLGITHFRHDVVEWGWRDPSQKEFEQVFATVVPVTQEIADYAAPLGIVTSVENHGFGFNNSERVRRLVDAVDRPNFRTTLDIGNFLCVDEQPIYAVAMNLPYASVIHLKDFYVRDERPGDGWLKTVAGNHIRGAIVGYGDLPMRRLLTLIKESGFDGPISIEFEGIEDDLLAIQTGLANAVRIWDEI